MIREIGDKRCPLWLLGDSNPGNWETQLETPLDPRHPARHNIWTPILDGIQDRLFRELRLRLETRAIYIRNAVQNAKDKPARGARVWDDGLRREVDELGAMLNRHLPLFVVTFGAFSFEFARRALGRVPEQPYSYWKTKCLGPAFREAISSVQLDHINVLPLLHATIARGHFIPSHEQYCSDRRGANYFEEVAQRITDVLIENSTKPEVSRLWIGGMEAVRSDEAKSSRELAER